MDPKPLNPFGSGNSSHRKENPWKVPAEGDIEWCNYFGKQFLKKSRIRPSNFTPRCTWKRNENGVHAKMCARTFPAALLVIATKGRNTQLSTD